MADVTRWRYVKVGSMTLETKEDSTEFDEGGVMNEEIVTESGKVHSMRKHKPSRLKTTIVHTTDTDRAALRALRGGTLTVVADDGTTITMPNATQKEIGPLKSGEMDFEAFGDVAIPQ